VAPYTDQLVEDAMIHLVPGRRGDPALDILAAGLRRSVSRGMVALADEATSASVAVFLAPREEQADAVAAAARRGKVLVFGSIGPRVADVCGVFRPSPLPAGWREAAECAPAPARGSTQSSARVEWSGHRLALSSPYRTRPFLRFDYASAWNNLGYGRITAGGGPWSVSVAADPGEAEVLAAAVADGLAPIPYVTLRETAGGAVLWWNRGAGPIDSAEWAVIESFLADWRADALASVPVLDEIPFGYDAALTMRLDCDGDIASARMLFELYRARGLPLSLAVMTGQPEKAGNVELLCEVHKAGGAIVAHSMTHPRNWGGSAEACIEEARGSGTWLEQRVPGLEVRHAVSPSHQNPRFVAGALARAGFTGFVGGIVANDPDMLLARGGVPPGAPDEVVSHSQQCMLHGDCMSAEGDPLGVPKAAFSAALSSRTLFGYLDHAISAGYDYGWGSVERQRAAHVDLLDYIAAATAGQRVLWLNLRDALDWIAVKSRVVVMQERGGKGFRVSTPDSNWQVSARYRGATVAAGSW
jgi:hypothetical protein